jgi:hypothetical protein
MVVTLNGKSTEIFVKKQGNVWVCRVGKAKVYWNKKYTEPYVILPGKTYAEIKKMKPLIITYLREYKRIVTELKKLPPLSFEGEGKTDTEYKYQPEKHVEGYVSAVPKWLTDVKIKQVCSGPKRTFTRGIRIPQEYKDMAKKYMTYCCNCPHRVECEIPCLTPDINSRQDILEGI